MKALEFLLLLGSASVTVCSSGDDAAITFFNRAGKPMSCCASWSAEENSPEFFYKYKDTLECGSISCFNEEVRLNVPAWVKTVESTAIFEHKVFCRVQDVESEPLISTDPQGSSALTYEVTFDEVTKKVLLSKILLRVIAQK